MFGFINWRLYVKLSQGFKWQLESLDEQTYAIQSYNLLNPLIEGRQSDFFALILLINGVNDEP
jgi:hypothetical protein